MTEPTPAPRDKRKARHNTLERLRRWEESREACLVGETEASLHSAFALADLLNALQRQ